MDGTTFYDVKTLSKQIDPVNFYIITTGENVEGYQSLALATDGKVASTADDLGILTDSIMERFDSLPRVEESEENPGPSPLLTVDTANWLSGTEYKVSFTTDADKTIVILNDVILGITNQYEITISDLNPAADNILTLVPIQSDSRGEPVSVLLGHPADVEPINAEPTNAEDTNTGGVGSDISHGQPGATEQPKFIIPKTPNTGRR